MSSNSPVRPTEVTFLGEPESAVRPKRTRAAAKDTRFYDLLADIRALYDRKQADYGRDEDQFANIRASAEFGIRPWLGALLRMNDKMKRLAGFATRGVLENESAEDSLMDIAVYSLIALLLYREERP